MTDKKQKTFNNVYDVLHHIQKNLHAPRSQFNKFGGYNYRSCEDILQGLKEVMPDGATLTIQDDIFYIEPRFYIKATATLSFAGESVSTTSYAREADNKKGMDDSQVTGAASSYARKYALNALFMIDDTKDADANENKEPDTKKEDENKKFIAERGAAIKQALESAKTIKTIDNIWNLQSEDLEKIKSLHKPSYDKLDNIYIQKRDKLEKALENDDIPQAWDENGKPVSEVLNG